MYENLLFYFIKCVNAEYHHTEKNGSFALQREGDTLYILFEKSNGRSDWRNNLLFFPKRTESDLYCHKGFFTVWNSILPYIENDICDKEIKRINVIGYSHGGAIATICYEYLYRKRIDIRSKIFSYAFGSPRVYFGDKKHETEKWGNHTVIINGNDIVTYLPPSVFFYKHVGKILQIGEDFSFSPIEAHTKESYEKSLKANCRTTFCEKTQKNKKYF